MTPEAVLDTDPRFRARDHCLKHLRVSVAEVSALGRHSGSLMRPPERIQRAAPCDRRVVTRYPLVLALRPARHTACASHSTKDKPRRRGLDAWREHSRLDCCVHEVGHVMQRRRPCPGRPASTQRRQAPDCVGISVAKRVPLDERPATMLDLTIPRASWQRYPGRCSACAASSAPMSEMADRVGSTSARHGSPRIHGLAHQDATESQTGS